MGRATRNLSPEYLALRDRIIDLYARGLSTRDIAMKLERTTKAGTNQIYNIKYRYRDRIAARKRELEKQDMNEYQKIIVPTAPTELGMSLDDAPAPSFKTFELRRKGAEQKPGTRLDGSPEPKTIQEAKKLIGMELKTDEAPESYAAQALGILPVAEETDAANAFIKPHGALKLVKQSFTGLNAREYNVLPGRVTCYVGEQTLTIDELDALMMELAEARTAAAQMRPAT